MAGTPKMQEQFSACAFMSGIPKNEACCVLNSGRHAENAGAISGECIDARHPEKRSPLRLK
jgi:hypothetical protein